MPTETAVRCHSAGNNWSERPGSERSVAVMSRLCPKAEVFAESRACQLLHSEEWQSLAALSLAFTVGLIWCESWLQTSEQVT